MARRKAARQSIFPPPHARNKPTLPQKINQKQVNPHA